MAKTSKRATKLLVKKKTWVRIISPKFLGEKELGESYIEEISNSVGKKVEINLMKITGDIKTQNCTVKFEINEAKDELLRTRIVAYQYLSSSIKRLVRRKMNRVDDSLVIMTKDNLKVRIKPMLLTRGKVSKSVEYKLRLDTKNELLKIVHKTNYDDLFSDVINNRIQRDLKNLLKPIHPLRAVLIRVLKEENHHAAKLAVEGKSSKKTKYSVKKEKSVEKVKEEKPKAEKTEEEELIAEKAEKKPKAEKKHFESKK